MNEKGAIELSIGTIVIIVLAIAWLILAMVLVRNFFNVNETVTNITACEQTNMITFTCDDGQYGYVKSEVYAVINENTNCTKLIKMECIDV